MKRSNEKGAALILALILIFVLSVMAVSLMFLSQSETWSSMNYRLMTQTRYGAEAGLNATVNYLSNIYVGPPSAVDPMLAYTLNTWPVQFGGQAVHLSNINGDPLPVNYPPAAGVITPFNTNTQGTVQSGPVNVTYNSSATLLSMYQVKVFDSPNPVAVQTWQITSTGSIGGIRNAQVQVSAIMEREIYPTFGYAAFATGNGCGSILFNGGGTVNSYDSRTMTLQGGSPVTQTYMGNLGSNGNVNTAANTVINGTFSSPDTGVGACAAGNVDALSGNVGAVTGCQSATCVPCPPPPAGTSCRFVKLPQPVNYPPPPVPSTVPDPTITNPPNILTPCSGVCPGDTGNYGNISASGSTTVTLQPGPGCTTGTYYINSLILTGNAQLTVAPCPGTNPPQYAQVFINVVGQGMATPLDLGGNGLANPTFNSSLVQILYAGTGAINIHGNGQTSAVIYAPKANVTLSGNGTIYGSVIGRQITDNGNPVQIHYDRALQNTAFTLGNWMVDSFTWNKF